MAKEGFEKFINKPVKSGKVKEAFRQEKKAAVRERRDAIEKHYEDKRNQKAERNAQQGSNEHRSAKGEAKPKYARSNERSPKGAKGGGRGRSTDTDFAKDGKRFPPAKKTAPARKPFERKPQPAVARAAEGKETPRKFGSAAGSVARPGKTYNGQKAAGAKPEYKKAADQAQGSKPAPAKFVRGNATGKPAPGKSFVKKGPVPQTERTSRKKPEGARNYMELLPEELAMNDENGNIVAESNPVQSVEPARAKRINPADKYKKKEKTVIEGAKPAFKKKESKDPEPTGEMPLNKFIAHAGVCSRRDAADVVRSGKVTVNGEAVTEPAFKVTDDAEVKVDGKKIQRSRNQVYILLNKPKDYITTSDDPQGRKTVMDIIKNATTERVYPVGRLDRNTSGVLLLTNDGDLAQKLSHPSFEVRKIYEVKLDKALQQDDFEKILSGVTLEDGEVHADSLAYGDKDKSVIGIEIHSGKNRVVRRLFEKLGYDVRGLDRVMYANLTKKNVERGKWRFLNDKEVRLLKYFNKSKA